VADEVEDDGVVGLVGRVVGDVGVRQFEEVIDDVDGGEVVGVFGLDKEELVAAVAA